MSQYPNQEPQRPYQGYYQQQSNMPYQSPYQQQTSSKERPSIKPLGRRGLAIAIGSTLSLIGYLLPYYASYSGLMLASIYGLYWLDGLLVAAAFLLLIGRLILPILETYRRRWAIAMMTTGAAGVFLHYVIVNMNSNPTYWGIGAWTYAVGMLVVLISGILLFITA